MRSTIGSKRELHGDWRRRYGSKTDAHLWHDGADYSLPLCRKNIEHYRTIALDTAHEAATAGGGPLVEGMAL